MYDLLGKTAIVTGAARGIGKEIAIRLATDGSNVIICDILREDSEKVVREIINIKREAAFVKTDITSTQQIKNMVKLVLDKFGSIDILVNNAGILGPSLPVWEYSTEIWHNIIETNLTGTFYTCREIVPVMLKQGSGKIVNMASVAGKEGNPSQCAYSAAKAGIIAFTKSLAKEVARKNILVNCISPVLITTELIKEVDSKMLKIFLDKIPMGRMGKPKEVAALVKFLVSDQCTFSTGSNFDLSGGRAVY
jgi:3-oxoacyl-[acyl-carrier protein] reductase